MIIKDNTPKERKTPNPFGQGNFNFTNIQALNWLKGVHPSLSQHIWQRNGLVQAIAMERFGGVDVLELPVCRSCEKPASWHDNDSAYCFSCGKTTPANETKTLYRYIAEDSIPYGMKEDDLELLHKMLMPTLSGALAEMFENIDMLEQNKYIPDDEEFETIETIIDGSEDLDNETQTGTDDHSV